MLAFQHVAAPLRLFSGLASLARLQPELARLGCRRAVIVCGGSLARNAPLLDQVTAALGETCAGVVPGVRAHSPVPAVEAVAAELRRLTADAVIAVGGGSAVVTARAASILLAEGKPAAALSTRRDATGALKSPRLMAEKLPQLIIPTTPNTATVKAGSAVYDPEAGVRLAMFDPKTRAQAVFVHPDFIGSAPRALVVTASLDTLTLALEGLTSTTGDPLADAALIHAVRLLAAHLPAPDDVAARCELVLAALLAGQGTDHTGAGAATVLGHAVGGRVGAENGLVKAIMLPHVLRFNEAAAPAGLAKIATALGLAEADAEPIVARLEPVFVGLGIPRRLRDIGVPEDALPDIAAHAMDDWFLRGNPRPVRDAAELQGLLMQAW